MPTKSSSMSDCCDLFESGRMSVKSFDFSLRVGKENQKLPFFKSLVMSRRVIRKIYIYIYCKYDEEIQSFYYWYYLTFLKNIYVKRTSLILHLF